MSVLHVYQSARFDVHDVKSGRLQMLQLLLGDDDAQICAGLPQPNHFKVFGGRRRYFGHSHRLFGRNGFDICAGIIIIITRLDGCG